MSRTACRAHTPSLLGEEVHSLLLSRFGPKAGSHLWTSVQGSTRENYLRAFLKWQRYATSNGVTVHDPGLQDVLDFNEELADGMKAAGVKSAWTGVNWVLGLFGYSIPLDVTARRQLRGIERGEV